MFSIRIKRKEKIRGQENIKQAEDALTGICAAFKTAALSSQLSH